MANAPAAGRLGADFYTAGPIEADQGSRNREAKARPEADGIAQALGTGLKPLQPLVFGVQAYLRQRSGHHAKGNLEGLLRERIGLEDEPFFAGLQA
jgi:hypothetical protein